MSWQNMAVWAADTAGVDRRIVLATVEAEGARNIMHDGGDGYGFGAVHLKWESHWNAMLEAAKQTSVDIPWGSFAVADKAALRNKVLSDDWFSMLLAAKVIGIKWAGAGGNWEVFTGYYVGQGIPASDRDRRRKIWQKWQGENVNAIPYPDGEVKSGGGGQNGPVAVAELVDGKIIISGLAVAVLAALMIKEV